MGNPCFGGEIELYASATASTRQVLQYAMQGAGAFVHNCHAVMVQVGGFLDTCTVIFDAQLQAVIVLTLQRHPRLAGVRVFEGVG